MAKSINDFERGEICRLYREQKLSMSEIGKLLGRNTASVGYAFRREDLEEEAAMCRMEEAGQETGFLTCAKHDS